MAQLNLHLSDDTQARLRALAKARGLTMTTMFTLLVDREWREAQVEAGGARVASLVGEGFREGIAKGQRARMPWGGITADLPPGDPGFAPDEPDDLTLEPFVDPNR